MSGEQRRRIANLKDSFFNYYCSKINSYIKDDCLGIRPEIQKIIDPISNDVIKVYEAHQLIIHKAQYNCYVNDVAFLIEASCMIQSSDLYKRLLENCPDKMEALDTLKQAYAHAFFFKSKITANYTELIVDIPFIEKFIEPPVIFKIRKTDYPSDDNIFSKEKREVIEKVLYLLIMNHGFSYKIPGTLDVYKAIKG